LKNKAYISQAVIWIVLIALLLICSVPFLFMITNSFGEFTYVLPSPPKLFPDKIQFAAYQYIISLPIFNIAVINSVVNTLIASVFVIFVSTLSAYGFAKIDFIGRENIFKLYIFTLMMPGFLNIIPQFITLKNMPLEIFGLENGLISTRAGLILIYVATSICGNTFFLRNFFRALPKELSESVFMDGGGHRTIFFKIILPLSKPSIGTLMIFSIQGLWEEYFTAKVLVGSNETMITLPLLLQRLNGQYSTRWEWVFAASLMALIPVIIIFLVFQKNMVVGGVASDSVKE